MRDVIYVSKNSVYLNKFVCSKYNDCNVDVLYDEELSAIKIVKDGSLRITKLNKGTSGTINVRLKMPFGHYLYSEKDDCYILIK